MNGDIGAHRVVGAQRHFNIIIGPGVVIDLAIVQTGANRPLIGRLVDDLAAEDEGLLLLALGGITEVIARINLEGGLLGNEEVDGAFKVEDALVAAAVEFAAAETNRQAADDLGV